MKEWEVNIDQADNTIAVSKKSLVATKLHDVLCMCHQDMLVPGELLHKKKIQQTPRNKELGKEERNSFVQVSKKSFTSEEAYYTWLQEPNTYFSGLPPLLYMAMGPVEIQEVETYLENEYLTEKGEI